jgi:hypothetical protein
MADAQLAREVVNLVVAGHETTASLLNRAGIYRPRIRKRKRGWLPS